MKIVRTFDAILKKALELNASDIHITAGGPFRMRIRGKMVPVNSANVLEPEDTENIARQILISGKKANAENVNSVLHELRDFDCSYSLAGIGRFRVNICSQRGSLAIVLRSIPVVVPTFEQLGLPSVLMDVAMEDRGLVLLTGVTGSGKSSTLAAMISHVNQNKAGKVVTIEDPIEFLHSDDKCNVIQRELGGDTQSFATALRAALRQDPDIIMVGEMRDKETIDIALKAVETGHLVFSTVHTADAPRTISRLVSFFEATEQPAVRRRLAETLRAVVSQRLLPRKDRTGRVLAVEIMRNTTTIEDCIADPEKTGDIKDYLAAGRDQYGMQTFDQHLSELDDQDLITPETAKAAATRAADFQRDLQFQ